MEHDRRNSVIPFSLRGRSRFRCSLLLSGDSSSPHLTQAPMNIELDSLSYALLASIFGAAALLSVRNSRGPDIHPLLLNTQADVSRVRYPGSSAIYRSRMFPNGSPLLYTLDRSIRTLKEFYSAAFEKHRRNPLASVRDPSGSYSWETYETVDSRAKLLFSGLVGMAGLEPLSNGESALVGIYASNSIDTFALEIACHSGGLVTVPISADAASSHLSHVLKNTGLKVLVVDAKLLERTLNVLRGSNMATKHIIVLGAAAVDGQLQKSAESQGLNMITIDELCQKGEKEPVEQPSTDGDTYASIYYSNFGHNNRGGVVLTHKNIVSVVASYHAILPPQQRITANDRLLHNFPIDNVFGHVLAAVLCVSGGSIAFGEEVAEGDVKTDVSAVLAPAAALNPTIYASGAPFLAQVKESIESQYGNSFLFKRGLDKKKAHFEEGRLVADTKYDMLVFRDIRQKTFGKKIRLLLVDNDETRSDLASFFRAVLGTQVINVLNRPETSSTTVASMFYDYLADPAAFGVPLPCNELKLEDLPDHGYMSDDQPNPRGEIWIRGNNVFAGYWKDPSATAEVMDSDGWFMTSIIGEILPNGTLKVLRHK
ncbi:hypothetical protein BX666DRAFT_2142523, partial [Dichotomocladium elegans]